ncbi:uncharacterized protein LOC134537174 [Bacillus rossius redtenbacheri]|uniref:uncharacterized protein LOC134537174 n=1 Tax=Bacillus rossius redtenbacheri TaxID=93214 RepID=UPI002FDE2CB1
MACCHRLLATIFLLGLAYTEGAALLCHESTCLDEDPLTACAFNNDTVLKECDLETFREASRRMNRPWHRIVTNLPTTCIKIEEEGYVGGEEATGVVRMCYLDLPEICRKLAEDPTDLVDEHRRPLRVACHTCGSDGCNGAVSRGPAAGLAALLAAVCGTLLA